MLRVEKRRFGPPRAGDQNREEDPCRGAVTEMEEKKANREKSDSEEGKRHPEDRPLIGRLAHFGAQTDGQGNREHQGRGKPGPYQRHPDPEGPDPVGNHGHRRRPAPSFRFGGKNRPPPPRGESGPAFPPEILLADILFGIVPPSEPDRCKDSFIPMSMART